MNGITKETWLKAPPRLRDELLFDMLLYLSQEIKAVKKWKIVNTAASGIGGMIGGIITIWAFVELFLKMLQ